MKKLIFIFSVTLIYSCSNNEIINYVEVETLSASSIYNNDSVYYFQNLIGEKNKQLAEDYKKKADEAEKKNIEKSLYYSKRAVTLNPSLENYLFLADKLEKNKKYEELEKLQALLIYPNTKKGEEYTFLFSKPDFNLIYSCLRTLINGKNSLYSFDWYILDDVGVDRAELRKKLLNDENITTDKNSEEFQLVLLQLLPYEEINKYAQTPEVFKKFISYIPEADATSEIDEHEIAEFKYNGSDDYYNEDYMFVSKKSLYQYYLVEKQQNSGFWSMFNFIRKYTINPNVVALEYAIDSSETACPREMRHIYRRLVTYSTKTAKAIDSKIIAYQSGEELMTAKITGKNIDVVTYTRKFKKPYNKKDFDNDLISVEKKGILQFSIGDNGNFSEPTQ